MALRFLCCFCKTPATPSRRRRRRRERSLLEQAREEENEINFQDSPSFNRQRTAGNNYSSSEAQERMEDAIPAFIAKLKERMGTYTTVGTLQFSDDLEAILRDIEPNQESITNGLIRLLRALPSALLISVVLSEMLDAVREQRTKEGRTPLVRYILALTSGALEDCQQREVYQILAGLPSSVLGDDFAQQHTRVLLDAVKDAKESQNEAVLKTYSQRELVDTVNSVVENLMSQIPSDRLEGVLVEILNATSTPEVDSKRGFGPSDRYRLVLQQILLSKLLPHDYDMRALVLREIFPESVAAEMASGGELPLAASSL